MNYTEYRIEKKINKKRVSNTICVSFYKWNCEIPLSHPSVPAVPHSPKLTYTTIEVPVKNVLAVISSGAFRLEPSMFRRKYQISYHPVNAAV